MVVLYLGMRKKVPMFVNFGWDISMSEEPQQFTRCQAESVYGYLANNYPKQAKCCRVLQVVTLSK